MVDIKRTFTIAIFMLLSAVAAYALTPRAAVPIGNTTLKLEQQVPKTFGEWRMEEGGMQQIVSPEVTKTLQQLYSDILTRTYVNPRGERIMLSLAYGRNQGRDLQVHKPEVCYRAQGFDVGGLVKRDVQAGRTTVPVMNLVATLGPRTEPITYWIRSGDTVVRGWYEQNRARLLSGLKGEVPDGLLVRVSSISRDTDGAYRLQEQFLRDMLQAIQPSNLAMFLGEYRS
jgi:EpsI family protein